MEDVETCCSRLRIAVRRGLMTAVTPLWNALADKTKRARTIQMGSLLAARLHQARLLGLTCSADVDVPGKRCSFHGAADTSVSRSNWSGQQLMWEDLKKQMQLMRLQCDDAFRRLAASGNPKLGTLVVLIAGRPSPLNDGCSGAFSLRLGSSTQ